MDILHHPKRLFDFLARHGVTHADIASFLDVSVSAVSSWSVERRRMPLGYFRLLLSYACQQTTPLMDDLRSTDPLDVEAHQRTLDYCYELRGLYQEQRFVYEASYRDLDQAGKALACLVKNRPPETWTADEVQRVQEASRGFSNALQEAVALKLLPISAQIDTGARQCDELIALLEALIKKGKKHATADQRRQRPSQPDPRPGDVPTVATPRPKPKRLRPLIGRPTPKVRTDPAPR